MAKKQIVEPAYKESPINNPVLNYKVYKMSGLEKFIYKLFLLVIGGAVGQVFYGGLFKINGEATTATYISNIIVFFLVGMITIKQALPILNERLRRKRNDKLKSQFRDFLSAFSTALSSGMNANNAILNAHKDLEGQYSSEALIVKEVSEMVACLKNNIPLEHSIIDFGERSDNEDIGNFATVYKTCIQQGGNLKEVVRRTSDIISDKMVIAEEIETKLTSNKMQMNVMIVIPIFVVAMMKGMSSDFGESLTSIIGVISITISIGIFVAAYKIGQKIMNIKG